MTKKAFTMAEVLITLGIIGIVAAMTLPALIGKYRSVVVRTQLKKMYSIVSQAMLRAVPEGDFNYLPIPRDGGGLSSVKYFYETCIKPYFKIMNYCENSDGCWAQVYRPDGTKYGNTKGFGSGILSFTTMDGYAFTIDTWSYTDTDAIYRNYGVETTGRTAIVVIGVDANGAKRPNTLGKDVFIYVLSDRGLLPAGHDKTDDEIENECNTTGLYCFEKLLRTNWEIDSKNTW